MNGHRLTSWFIPSWLGVLAAWDLAMYLAPGGATITAVVRGWARDVWGAGALVSVLFGYLIWHLTRQK